jgi:hypothetical protein
MILVLLPASGKVPTLPNQMPGMAPDSHASYPNVQQAVPSNAGATGGSPTSVAPTANDRAAIVDESGEITIEAYMAALLDRVRNKTDNLAPREIVDASGAKKEATAAPKTDGLASSAAGESQILPQEVPAPQLPAVASPASQPLQLPRVRRDPLEHLDLEILRTLAQSHAEDSIDKHVRRQLSFAAVRQAAIVLVGLIGGCLFAFLPRSGELMHMPSVVSFAIAIVWALHCAQSMLSLAHQGDRSPQLAKAIPSPGKRSPLPKGGFSN